jgi:hypothetical protein
MGPVGLECKSYGVVADRLGWDDNGLGYGVSVSSPGPLDPQALAVAAQEALVQALQTGDVAKFGDQCGPSTGMALPNPRLLPGANALAGSGQ